MSRIAAVANAFIAETCVTGDVTGAVTGAATGVSAAVVVAVPEVADVATLFVAVFGTVAVSFCDAEENDKAA